MSALISRKGYWMALAAGILFSCSQQAGAPVDTPDIQVSALHGTAAETAAAVQLTLTPLQDGYAVSLEPGAAPLGSEVYLGLEYDAAALHVDSLQPRTNDDSLGLAVESAPGKIEFGLVAIGAGQLAADAPLLTFELKPGASEPRAASAKGNKWAAHAAEDKARYISLDFSGTAWLLSWDYTNPGDTNQNSVVGIDDLSPLGKNFRRVIETGWQQPLRHVDCDHNGEINVSDLSPIGKYFNNDVMGYWVQASANGIDNWVSFAELQVSDQEVSPSNALRFRYDVTGNYQPNVYYRVQPFTHDRQPGEPSESVCNHHRIFDTRTEPGGYSQVTVSALGLDSPLRMLDSVRVIYPDSYTYVPYSYNIGAAGGETYDADGIWQTFVNDVIRPPDEFYYEVDRGDGYKEIAFAVAVSDSFFQHAQTLDGALFNFELWNNGDQNQLTLTWEDIDEDDQIKVTYYSDGDFVEHFFGNDLTFDVN